MIADPVNDLDLECRTQSKEKLKIVAMKTYMTLDPNQTTDKSGKATTTKCNNIGTNRRTDGHTDRRG